jgi:type VI secretion system secreted protein VgrG
MRVSQTHAGNGFGGISIPRVGEEVIVSFIEGDPDRPIITGRVYHQEAMPPFELPGEKTRSGIKTKTYKGNGYNELSMDDTQGKEQIRIHAQYNMNSQVLHDQTLDVGNNQRESVGNDRTRSVNNNETIEIGANQDVTIGAEATKTIGGHSKTTVGANQEDTVGGNRKVTIAGDFEQTAGGKQNETAMEITLTALTKITLMCGASSIVIDPASVTIMAPLVKLNC